MKIFMCFIRADLEAAPSLQNYFVKYAAAENAQGAEEAVRAWCMRIGVSPQSVSAMLAGNQRSDSYDWVRQMIVAKRAELGQAVTASAA